MIDRKRTYLAKIEASVGSTLFRNLYVKEDSLKSSAESSVESAENLDATADGRLSCAVHVSSVLTLSGLLPAPCATVKTLVDKLLNSGWYVTTKPTTGAIIIWSESADGHKHAGFFMSENLAISNSTKLRVPAKHNIVMDDGRKPVMYLTHDIIVDDASGDNNNSVDTRNVVNKYRNQSVESIVDDLDKSRSSLEIAIENLERDFNMGTIVRTANAFNVERIHIIGRRQWNKRGAMKTDAYLHLSYHATVDDFVNSIKKRKKAIIAVDIVPGAKPLQQTTLPAESVLVFGAEGSGISTELLQKSDEVVFIEQFGSTRSINVGVAAGIAMYSWMQQHHLSCVEAPFV